MNFMSSEESNDDDDSVNIHQLPYVASVCNDTTPRRRNAQALRQMKPRKVGMHSSRSHPIDQPDWAVARSTDSV